MQLDAEIERWPIKGQFRISRGSKTEACVVVVRIESHGIVGHGESVPYARYGESPESVIEQINCVSTVNLDTNTLQQRLPAGAARNALDCALWDLAAKQAGTRVWDLLSLQQPRALDCAYTISLGRPDEMRSAAIEHSSTPVLKIKLGSADDLGCVTAVRDGAPAAKLIVDANEAWSPEEYLRILPELEAAQVAVIEQPLPADADDALADLPRPIPICADESCHDSRTVAALSGKYDMINIKLDKTGGLTEAFALLVQTNELKLAVMVGCMVGTSLSMAPALMVAQHAEIVDLDGPLLLRRDRKFGLRYEEGKVFPPERSLWG